jgi:alpha-tubulin suppressor-like RCC1 family protein
VQNGADINPPQRFVLGTPADTLFCGEHVTTLKLKDGTVMSSGGQLPALGRPDAAAGNVPILIPNLVDVATLASGATDSIAVTTGDGRIAWGVNLVYELATATKPVTIGPAPQLQPFEDFAVGDNFACGLQSGSVYCWGDNRYGQLGDGTQTTTHIPRSLHIGTLL